MNTWVLIIAMFSPGGDFMGMRHEVLPSQQACLRAKVDAETSKNPMGVKVKGRCVNFTQD